MIHTHSSAAQPSVAELALQYPQALQVFLKYDIDFCCGGKHSLRETCEKKGLNPDMIWSEIVHKKNHTFMRFDLWNKSLMVDFIIQNHHAYVKKEIPVLQELLDKVCNVHGEDHIELLEMRDDFNDLAEELVVHMSKEEKFLFPAIKNADVVFNFDGPIAAMEEEHDLAGDLMKSIRQLSHHYAIPRDACPTLQLTYQKLQEFDHDLMQHIHLENNVLFKKLQAQDNQCHF